MHLSDIDNGSFCTQYTKSNIMMVIERRIATQKFEDCLDNLSIAQEVSLANIFPHVFPCNSNDK